MKVATLRSLIVSGIVVFATPVALACPLGASDEQTLQQVLDEHLDVSPNAAAACADTNDQVWQFASTTGGAGVIIEIAGFSEDNVFGMYDINDTNNRLIIFNGVDGVGSTRLITTGPPGGPYAFTVSGNSFLSNATFATAQFGFFLDSPDGGGTTFYSETSRNAGGQDQMLAFKGNGTAFTSTSAPLGFFNANDYILAWEDLIAGDDDYQDFVAVVRNVTPTSVPLPAAAWLLLSGLGALGSAVRCRKRAQPV